ncbi:MAG: type II toxin-antitoxin system HigB family toxin [Bacteroides sp.]|nr:type II toxin-antitoxin system HigB family toxin [Bacteroides sp.]
MRIISRKTLISFYTKHADAKVALEEWFSKTQKAEWENFAEIKNTFNSVDHVGNQHYVFHVKGNDYRLVAVIKFQIKMVYIRYIGTHKEYEKINASNI